MGAVVTVTVTFFFLDFPDLGGDEVLVLSDMSSEATDPDLGVWTTVVRKKAG